MTYSPSSGLFGRISSLVRDRSIGGTRAFGSGLGAHAVVLRHLGAGDASIEHNRWLGVAHFTVTIFKSSTLTDQSVIGLRWNERTKPILSFFNEVF